MLAVLDNIGFTQRNAFHTAFAKLTVKENFFFIGKRFRIVTPFTAQGTTFKKDGCAYSVAVMDLKGFYRKDH